MTERDWGDMAGEGFDGFTLSHRDRALFEIEGHRDLEAQLRTIQAFLARNQDIEQNALRELQRFKNDISSNPKFSAEYREHLIDVWGEDFHAGIFQGAAHSMAAVGMLAPFTESLFVAIFDSLKTRLELPPDDPRQNLRKKDLWNPQVYQGSSDARKDLPRGIMQLSEGTGLARFLPSQTDICGATIRMRLARQSR